MSDATTIEWTDATWNPVRGCSRVSQGCVHCYAEGVARRFSGPGQPYEGLINKHGSWNGNIKFVDHVLEQPLRWRRPRRIFVNSMSDLFHENCTDEQIDRIFRVMDSTDGSRHTFQVLTKRPERMRDYMLRYADKMMGPPPNVWLGVSVENQAAYDERVPLLLETPAYVRFLSVEPLLGPVSIKVTDNLERPQLHWVIVGGESGPGARPMHPTWVRGLRHQCRTAGIAFFFKQWGAWAPNETHPERMFVYADGSTDIPDMRVAAPENNGETEMARVGKKAAGRLLDGQLHDEFPGETA